MSNEEIIAQQKARIEALEKELKEAQLLAEDQKFQMEYMRQEIELLKHRTYGRRSEQLDKKYPTLFDDYDVFNEAEDEAKEINEPINIEDGEPQEVTFTVKGTKKKNLVNRLDKLKEVEIRDLWKHEQYDFSTSSDIANIPHFAKVMLYNKILNPASLSGTSLMTNIQAEIGSEASYVISGIPTTTIPSI